MTFKDSSCLFLMVTHAEALLNWRICQIRAWSLCLLDSFVTIKMQLIWPISYIC